MFGLGPTELGIIFLIVLLLFGANRIPEVARGLGRGIRDFKKATRDIEDDLDLRDDRDPRRISRRPSSESASSTAGASEKQPTSSTEKK